MASRTAIVVYAGVFRKSGSRYFLSEDTHGRCKKALEVAKRENKSVIFLNAGRQPGNPETTHSRVMFDWFRAYGFNGDIVMSDSSEVTNTAIETAIADRRIGQIDEFDRVVAITSWYHMPRVMLLWKLLFKRTVSFAWSDETERPIFSILWEIGGFGKLILNYLRKERPFNRPAIA